MKKAHSLMAALAVSLVSATVFAGPKFEELERAIPADVVEADPIYTALVGALGGDAEAIKLVQAECGLATTGALATQTQRCLKNHAAAVSAARKHAAADRLAIEADLGGCNTARGECDVALADMTAERDEALARAGSGGGGEDYGELVGICAKVDLTQFVGTCDPVSQNARCVPDDGAPLGFTVSCVPKRVHGEVASLTIRPDGSADAQFNVTPQKGTLAPAALPWQVPPQPFPEAEGTCDGFGGVLLCYALPVAVVVVGGLLIADAASSDFNLVTIRR